MTATPLPAAIRRRRPLKHTGPLCPTGPSAGAAFGKVSGVVDVLGLQPSRAPIDGPAPPTHAGRGPCPNHLIFKMKSPIRRQRWEAALSLVRAVEHLHPDDDLSWPRARHLVLLILHDLMTWFGPEDLALARRGAKWFVRLLSDDPRRARSAIHEALARVEEQTSTLHAQGAPAQYGDRGQVAVLQARLGHYGPLVEQLKGHLGPLNQQIARLPPTAAEASPPGLMDRVRRWFSH